MQEILLKNCKKKDINEDYNIFNKKIYELDKKSINIKNLENFNQLHKSNIKFEKCIFLNSLEITSFIYHDIQKTELKVITLQFEECIFLEDVDIKSQTINCELIFNNCIFIKDLNLEKSFFKNYCDFSNSIFFNNINFFNTTFDSKVCFKYITLNNEYKLNLEYVYINNTIEFFGISSKKIENNNISRELINNINKEDYLNIKNRETARIIKNSFEQQNNIIEANKFYALEMKKYDEEITWKKNFKEKLIFKLHDWSSGHSQNWLLPLFWILILSCGYGLYQDFFLDKCISNYFPILSKIIGYILVFLSFSFIVDNIIENKKLKNYSLPFIFVVVGFYFLITNDLLLELPAKAINPFSVMNDSDNINGVQLVFKITIAYLIYQLIISIRQNTRRK